MTETFDIVGLSDGVTPGEHLTVRVRRADGSAFSFTAVARIDSPIDSEYLRHGGILNMVLRNLMMSKAGVPGAAETMPAASVTAAATGGVRGGVAGSAGSQTS